MKRVIVVGAGGFGREIQGWFEDWRRADPSRQEFSFSGFLDGNPNAFEGIPFNAPILGNPETYRPQLDDVFICGLGLPRIRMHCCRALQARGANFITVIHPTAVIGPRCSFGLGCVICPYAVVTCDVQLGDFVVLNVHSSVGHDVRLGHGVTLSGHADVTGRAVVGDEVFLGSHACVIPGAKVPNQVFVGAGSVYIRGGACGETLFGVPATVMPRLNVSAHEPN